METAARGIIERSHAEEVLELPKILSLLAEHCQTKSAKSRALTLRPANNLQRALEDLNRVREVYEYSEKQEFFIPFDPGYIKTLINAHPYLPVEIIFSIKLFLVHTKTLKQKFKKNRLEAYFSGFNEYKEIVEAIERVINQNRQVKDDASVVLQRVRQRRRSLVRQIMEVLNRMIANQPGLFSDANVVERNNRYVLPVRNNFKKDVRGIIHSYSNSGETVFVEPAEITESSAELADLDRQEAAEIERLLAELTAIIGNRVGDIEADTDRLVDLDLLFARAAFARDLGAVYPEFDDRIRVNAGFHPILKKHKPDLVPLDFALEPHKRVLLISGPNAGGKTVVLKTVGLLALMAKCGLYIPAAEGTTMPFYEEVYADIGDEQSIESDLSTFAGHIRQIKAALDASGGRCLVLLDELMNQTSVEEGSALARAILCRLARTNKTVLATTHNENLKLFVGREKNMLNAGMEFTDRPTYRLITGIPQPSNAIKLAQQMGIDAGITEEALTYLDREKVSLNKIFEDLAAELRSVREEKDRLAALTAEYEKNIGEIRTRKKKEIDDFSRQQKKELVEAKRAVERLIRQLKKEGPKKEVVTEARRFFDKQLTDNSLPSYTPHVGELVRIHGMKRPGLVIAEHQGKYKVSLDNMFFWVRPQEIEAASER